MMVKEKFIQELLFFGHMLFAILKSAFRNIEKRKFNTLLSVIGLTVGFSSFILISMFIKYELSWDSFHENYHRIYRIQTYKTVDDERLMQTSPALSTFLENKYNDIEKHTIVFPNQKQFLSISEEKEAIEKKGQYADQSYIDIFSYEFIYGSKNNALNEPLSVILSSTLAKTLFEDIDPVGKTIILQKRHNMKVTGVYKDLPKNSHLRPEFVISFASLEVLWNREDLFDHWDWNAYYNYVLLNKGADYKNVDASIKDILKDKVKTDYRQLYLRPLSKLYMYSTNDNYLTVLYLLGIFSIFVLILASINYINISIASSSLRGKEIGIKKAIGSSRRALLIQVFLESFITTIFSFLIALVIVELALNIFNQALDKGLKFSILFQDGLILILLAIILIAGIISSIYPAWLITSIKSIDLFKKKSFFGGKKQISLKKSLVVFQFSVSILLITLTVLISKQMRYTQTMDIGFEKSNLLFAQLIPSVKGVTIKQIKNKLRSESQILSISSSGGFPIHSSRYVDNLMINWEGGARDQMTEVRSFWVSYDFIKTLDLKVVKGRGFSEEFPGDINGSCVINETAAKKFDWDDPIGKYIGDRQWRVIGIIKDMHFHDMYNTIRPIVLHVKDDDAEIAGPVFFAFRTNPNSTNSIKGSINSVLKESFPTDPFEVKVFNDHFKTDEIFEIYRSINSLFFFFAFIAVILSILGVVGLVTHSLQQRTKEIAIRKISGCSSFAMFKSITFEYILLIILASVIGSFGAHYMYGTMPINYPFEQTIMDFLIAIIITLLITLASIGHKTWKESSRNPVEALRYE